MVKDLTNPDEIILTAEYEFPTLRYYSQREVRTSAPQQDYEGKYWWVWDSADIATALRRGQKSLPSIVPAPNGRLIFGAITE